MLGYSVSVSKVRVYIAASVDGFIATPTDGVDWLQDFDPRELGYEEFVGGVGTVVMGRTTYEKELSFGPWSHGDRSVIIVTSRPVPEPPPNSEVVGIDGLAAAVERAQVAGGEDVWVVGGGKLIQACLEQGLVDELELYVIPRLLGDGIPLFEPRTAAVSELALTETRSWPSGVVKLRYAVPR